MSEWVCTLRFDFLLLCSLTYILNESPNALMTLCLTELTM